jgi:hypothetical protein
MTYKASIESGPCDSGFRPSSIISSVGAAKGEGGEVPTRSAKSKSLGPAIALKTWLFKNAWWVSDDICLEHESR